MIGCLNDADREIFEFAEVLHAAFANLLVTAPSPAHKTVDVTIDDRVATMLLRRRGIEPGCAAEFAKTLRTQMGRP
ncbi:hypothetical protein HFO56_24470 [Rhizobium laguerreae]|uniref:hypothetical protein n=1 Tax=Rhizobium laguerreae TaxID=1076926 RepID=UPI001C9267FD|nr:hypothetical protein [Rhizobium laguerreae]MBY3155486.1 hypothetical protein [Rhizobium laguerreae]